MENIEKIRVGICGYGNLGRGVKLAVEATKDMELKVIFTRRDPETLDTDSKTKVVSITEAANWVKELDVVIMCGGSKDDLPKQMPEFARLFNTVNTFDTHADIQSMYKEVDAIAKEAGKVSVISTGWDPGLFSNIRKLCDSIFADAKYYTFWGPGVSQGHSDALRKIAGVKNAIQYTMPNEEVMDQIRSGVEKQISTTDMHERVCYVVAEEKDHDRIKQEICTMPKYFAGYKTTIYFVTEEEVTKRQSKMYHEGWVICVGKTGDGNHQVMEFHLKLDSNPEFTACVATSAARAAVKMNTRGESGARTMPQIATEDMATDEMNQTFKYI